MVGLRLRTKNSPDYCYLHFKKISAIAVLNKMRYTPLATDAHGGHGGLCPPEHLMLLRKAILHCLLIVLDARVVRNRVFLPKDALQTAEQGKKPGYEGFDASRTN